MGNFVMPSLGADMEAGTLVEWLKAPGEPVARGDIIAVVETQKGAIEIEAFEAGTLESYLVEIGQKVPVGTPMAVISGAEAAPPAPVTAPPAKEPPAPEPPAKKPAPVKAAPEKPAPIEAVPVKPAAIEPAPEPAAPPPPPKPAPAPGMAPPAPGARPRITPAALRLAQTARLDPRGITGTGPGGAITLDDVRALAIRAPGPPTLEVSAPPDQSGMRAAIAAAMSRSKREIPHYYLSHTVDLTRAQAFVSAHNAQHPPEERLLMGALFVAAVAKAVAKYGEFNGHYSDGVFTPGKAANTGMAINLRGGGLVAPSINDADKLGVDALMAAMRDLAARVRAGRFKASELTDATITITSLGDRGVDQLFGVIYPPQVAIVGFGTPAARAQVAGEQIVARLCTTVTLAADHRVSDGHRGALFLRAIDTHLQTPETL